VVLCDELGAHDGVVNTPPVTGEACAVARGWLTELSR